MPILVTGGTGVLGRNLVRHLVGQGHRVRLLVRSDPVRLGLESDLIEYAHGDITDPQAVMAAVRGCEQVYHLAAWVQVSAWGMSVARRVNVEGTRYVCAAALALGVKRVVHASSIAAIATGTMEQPADEATPWNLEGTRTPYYVTKRESERVVLDYVRQGLDAVIANPSFLIGSWDVKPTSGRVLIHLAKGHVLIVPAGGINVVDVREAAQGHVLAMDKGRTGERYILGGENLSFRTFAARAAAIAGVAPPKLTLPYVAMLPFALAGSALGRIAPRLFRDINLASVRSACTEHYVTSAKACAELGYKPVAVDSAIEEALNWFSQHGYISRPPRLMSKGRNDLVGEASR